MQSYLVSSVARYLVFTIAYKPQRMPGPLMGNYNVQRKNKFNKIGKNRYLVFIAE